MSISILRGSTFNQRGFISPQPYTYPNVFTNGGFNGDIRKKEERVSARDDLSIKPLNILMVDDDLDDRDFFKDAIEAAALKVNLEFVEDGMGLIDKLNSGKQLPDILFLDLNLPNKSGKECLKEIRRNERLKKINVVIYSTSSSDKDIEETFEMGANLYITKPPSFKEVVRMVSIVLALDWNKYKPHAPRHQFLFSFKTM